MVVFSEKKDDETMNCCGDNEEEETEITGTELEDVVGFLKKIKETLIHKIGGGMALMETATFSGEEVETSIVLAIEWRVIGSNKKENVFTQVLCRSPVNSLRQSELETMLKKFEETLRNTVTVTGGMAFMETLAFNSCEVDEQVETPIVLAMERRRRVINGSNNKTFDFTHEVLHRLLVKYLSPSPSPSPSESIAGDPFSALYFTSKCVENPCDFSIPCKADPPFGLFVPCPEGKNVGYDLVCLDSVTSRPSVPSIGTLKFIPCVPNGRFDIICSCNGVLLCSFGYYAEFYLWNPTLNTFTTLPKLDGLDLVSFIDMAIAFDPAKSPPQYQVIALRVIGFGEEGDDNRELEIQIAVYSSLTGEWRDCSHEAFVIGKSTKFHGRGVFCKDAVYWLQPQRVVCFNLVEEELQYIIHPTTSIDPERREAITRDFLVKSGQDTLLYVCFSLHYEELLVWELGREDDSKDLRWFFRYHVDIKMACRYQSSNLTKRTSFDVVYFMESENEKNGFFVFKANGNLILYDMALQNIRSICYPSSLDHYKSDWIRGSYSWYDAGDCSYCFPFQCVSPSGM